MKTKFIEFLNEASINANGELSDFNFNDDEENNFDPFHEETVGDVREEQPNFNWDEGDDGEDNLDKENLEVKINNNEDFLDFDRVLPMFRVRGLKIISFWYKDNGGMVDREMLGIFPEFNLPHFYEGGSEGSLEYDGRMTIPQLEEFFIAHGFDVSHEPCPGTRQFGG